MLLPLLGSLAAHAEDPPLHQVTMRGLLVVPDDALRNFVFEISNMRNQLDPRTQDYCDSYHRFANWVRGVRGKKKVLPKEVQIGRDLARKINQERNKIRNNKEVMEELLRD